MSSVLGEDGAWNSPKKVVPRPVTVATPGEPRWAPRTLAPPTTALSPKAAARSSSFTTPFWNPATNEPTRRSTGQASATASMDCGRSWPLDVNKTASASGRSAGCSMTATCPARAGRRPTGTVSSSCPLTSIEPRSCSARADAGRASKVTRCPAIASAADMTRPSDPAPTKVTRASGALPDDGTVASMGNFLPVNAANLEPSDTGL